MSDNLKTWPEKFMITPNTLDGGAFPKKRPLPDYTESYASASTTIIPAVHQIEYIRADIADEREKKLIVAQTVLIIKGVTSMDYEDIYKAAKLEELK